MGAIRERLLEHFDESTSREGHPLEMILEECLKESDDNTWDAIVDKTTTHGSNGLRMPYCDKAQKVLKREFRDRPKLTERQLKELRGYMKEVSTRPEVSGCSDLRV